MDGWMSDCSPSHARSMVMDSWSRQVLRPIYIYIYIYIDNQREIRQKDRSQTRRIKI